MKKNEAGQALVGGLILIVIVMLFSVYFLMLSETNLRLFSNAEKANLNIVKEYSKYANILNEIAFNNQNIITSLTVAQDGLINALEHGMYLSFFQPYWETKSFKNGNSFTQKYLSEDTKKLVKKIFDSYSLNSARGLFLAKALAERNIKLKEKLPSKLKVFFIQSSNKDALCFALEAENEYYGHKGINFFGSMFIYHVYMNRVNGNKCAIEHKANIFNKLIGYPDLISHSNEKDFILDYKNFDNLSSSKNKDYGILYVAPKEREAFINALNFSSYNKINNAESHFTVIENYLSKLEYFKDTKIGNSENYKKSPLQNKFYITNKYLSCSGKCSPSEEQFLKSFFYKNWAVTGDLYDE